MLILKRHYYLASAELLRVFLLVGGEVIVKIQLRPHLLSWKWRLVWVVVDITSFSRGSRNGYDLVQDTYVQTQANSPRCFGLVWSIRCWLSWVELSLGLIFQSICQPHPVSRPGTVYLLTRVLDNIRRPFQDSASWYLFETGLLAYKDSRATLQNIRAIYSSLPSLGSFITTTCLLVETLTFSKAITYPIESRVAQDLYLSTVPPILHIGECSTDIYLAWVFIDWILDCLSYTCSAEYWRLKKRNMEACRLVDRLTERRLILNNTTALGREQ